MSISTQITVVATAEQIIITAPGALRGPQGIPGPMGDVTPEVTQLVADAEAAAASAIESKGEAAQSEAGAKASALQAEDAALGAAEKAELAEMAAEQASSSTFMAAAYSNPALSVADGLTKTSGSGSTNRFFSVFGAGETLAIAYRNDSGVAIEVGRSPSSLLVNAMSNGSFPSVGLQWISLPVESGYAWALADKNLRFALAVTISGKVVGNFDIDIPDLSGVEYLLPLKNLWVIGDSLTDNAPWQTLLAALVSERSMVQTAMGGQTGDQLSAKAGAQPALLTVQNNVIPATGAVAVTDITVRLLSTPAYNSVTFTMKGWLRGVYGTLTCASNAGGDLLDEYSFTRDVAGTAVYCPSRTPFKPDLAGKDFWTPIVWVGRNNLTYPEDVKGNIEAIVNVQKTAQKRFLIMTPPLGGTQVSGQSTTEGVGSVFYNNCRSVEDWATRKYGDRVLNMRELLMQFGDGSADDLDDIAKGVVPRSLRTDTLHLNAKGNGHVADLLAYEINRRGW